MAEPDEIVAAALAVAGPRDLAGRRILITAGGTREPLDPVRFIGNRSSGKQGVALARAAAARGADVTLVVANIEEGVLAADGVAGVEVVHVSTTLELQEATAARRGTGRHGDHGGRGRRLPPRVRSPTPRSRRRRRATRSTCTS